MRAAIGSVAVHALLVWFAVHGEREGRPRSTAPQDAAITLIETVEVDLLPSSESGVRAGEGPTGGAPAAPATISASTHARASTTHARATATRSRAVDADPRGAIRIEHTDPRGDIRTDETDATGEIGTDGRGTDGRGTDGQGTDGQGIDGRGTGRTGTGIGFGDGGAIQRAELLAPPPAPRGDPPSKAQPARLSYPSRQRDAEDAELFIARVIIDDEGFVDGATLVRGFGGRRDEVASQMIWKFRYAPALDDRGKPVRSTLDQRFLVGP